MRVSLQKRAQSLHAQREAAHRLRRRRTVARRDGARAEVDGAWLLECCGNDYLGLSRHPAVVAARRVAVSVACAASASGPVRFA